ncbi:MAG: response regulator transcription factor [Cloacibacillus porcorum]|uniref:response regulator transcription factor n=1 Tax=Cloacibacillus porcorum TaxID=1197717 RepID=UPI0023F1D9D8|nr:response regulator transcription factor [Cloacibacillus porcorum]MCD7877787.1 response regulator transcription factor [Cloacibacillus porcorum]
MIKLFIADDHELFREGLKSLQSREKDIEIVGSASDGLEAVNAVRRLKPEVVLMDVTMPNMNGIQATANICSELPDIAVIVISMHNDRRFIADALKAGARGYVLKESSPELMLDAIRTVSRNEVFFSPKVCTVLVSDYLRLLGNEEVGRASQLSEREMEVLQLLVKGRNGKQVADALSISKNTVDTHRRRIMDKLGCESMAELTKYAIREGFLTLE